MFSGMPDPMPLKAIDRFVKRNPDISINVYTITGNDNPSDTAPVADTEPPIAPAAEAEPSTALDVEPEQFRGC